jgi:hypothetical protein
VWVDAASGLPVTFANFDENAGTDSRVILTLHVISVPEPTVWICLLGLVPIIRIRYSTRPVARATLSRCTDLCIRSLLIRRDL